MNKYEEALNGYQRQFFLLAGKNKYTTIYSPPIGIGKTYINLAWCEDVYLKTEKPVLYITSCLECKKQEKWVISEFKSNDYIHVATYIEVAKKEVDLSEYSGVLFSDYGSKNAETFVKAINPMEALKKANIKHYLFQV